MPQLRETAEMKSKIINFSERISHVASTDALTKTKNLIILVLSN
jgi:hypothetical protein